MAYNFSKISILIVEDNAPMADLIRSLLETYGFMDVIVAKDGDEAFQVFQENPVDLIITDWMMKPIDGITFARRVRNDPLSPNQFVPVILITGFSERRMVMNARDAGVTEFLMKPFNARDLYRRITQIIERPRLFVRSENFFGPDRRRIRKTNYKGPERRSSNAPRDAWPINKKKKKAKIAPPNKESE